MVHALLAARLHGSAARQSSAGRSGTTLEDSRGDREYPVAPVWSDRHGQAQGEDSIASKKRRLPHVGKIKRDDPFCQLQPPMKASSDWILTSGY